MNLEAWRARRRWRSFAGGVAFVAILLAGVEVVRWADRRDVEWLGQTLYGAIIVGNLVYSFVSTKMMDRRMGSSGQRRLLVRSLRFRPLPGPVVVDRWRPELQRIVSRDDVGAFTGMAAAGVVGFCLYIGLDRYGAAVGLVAFLSFRDS